MWHMSDWSGLCCGAAGSLLYGAELVLETCSTPELAGRRKLQRAQLTCISLFLLLAFWEAACFLLCAAHSLTHPDNVDMPTTGHLLIFPVKNGTGHVWPTHCSTTC